MWLAHDVSGLWAAILTGLIVEPCPAWNGSNGGRVCILNQVLPPQRSLGSVGILSKTKLPDETDFVVSFIARMVFGVLFRVWFCS